MKKNKNSELTERLVQGSIEGLAIEVAMNTIMPGSGLAVQGLKQAKNLKKVAKIAGKGAAKEGVKMLDDEENENPAEELSGDIALEVLSRSRTR